MKAPAKAVIENSGCIASFSTQLIGGCVRSVRSSSCAFLKFSVRAFCRSSQFSTKIFLLSEKFSRRHLRHGPRPCQISTKNWEWESLFFFRRSHSSVTIRASDVISRRWIGESTPGAHKRVAASSTHRRLQHGRSREKLTAAMRVRLPRRRIGKFAGPGPHALPVARSSVRGALRNASCICPLAPERAINDFRGLRQTPSKKADPLGFQLRHLCCIAA